MSLIEQFGGYGAVKQMWIDGGSLEGTQLEFELLEHRRANNIFEIGDKVVFLSNIAPEHDGIYTITEVFKNSCFVIEDGMDYRAFYGYIRHATDEEIKAGRRL